MRFHFDNSYLALPEQLYSKVEPEKAPRPELVIWNDALATRLGVAPTGASRIELAQLFSGNLALDGAATIAQAYAGHQFGHFSLLGDGRALLLGEHIAPDGQRFDVQFKGSGRTPYSRRGDGKAALGPMLREYIVSEAMHALGIPTTRSLAVVQTGEDVYREIALPGAILTRIAASHIRVGTFEYVASLGQQPLLEALLDYTVARHYPNLEDDENKALEFLKAVSRRQVDLIVHWMRVGFIHGVMNTDNMALSGETIDYGPCAFMDNFNPQTVFSSIDYHGRYAYGNQPVIAQWNLARLAETLLPMIDEDVDRAVAQAEDALNAFDDLFQQKWLIMMGEKLGLENLEDGDQGLISELLNWMQRWNADYTNTFCELADMATQKSPLREPNQKSLYLNQEFQSWYVRWQARLERTVRPRSAAVIEMRKYNPVVIPRNHIVERVLSAADEGSFQLLHELLAILQSPYTETAASASYRSPPLPEERSLSNILWNLDRSSCQAKHG